MEILTLLKANIKYKKGAFKSITVLMTIITMSLTAIISNNDNNIGNLNKSHEKSDTGDIIVYIPTAQLENNILSKISDNQEVERIRDVEAMVVNSVKLKINGNDGENTNFIAEWKNNYNIFDDNMKSYLKEPQELNKGEIYVPLAYTTLYDCEIGSEIIISTKNGNEIFKIKGFVEEPLNGAYFIGIKLIFISSTDFKRLITTSTDNIDEPDVSLTEFSILHIYKSPHSDLSVVELKNELNEQYNIINNAYFTLSRADSVTYTKMIADIVAGILFVFIILLFIIVLIVMGHSISTGIEMDYVNLGVLKSQGFTKGKIRTIFILQYLIAEIIGVVLGVFLSIPLTSIIGKAYQPLIGMLSKSDISLLKSLVIVMTIFLLSGMFIFITTAKIGKISPVRAISGGSVDTVMLMLNVIAAVIYTVSVVFSLVVVNMVCSKTFIKEKRDIGIYKAIGFSADNLRIQFALRFLFLSFIGAGLGAVLSLMFTKKLLDILMRSSGISNFITYYNAFTFIVPISLICGCFFLFSYIATRKIKKVAVKDLVVE